MKYKDNKSVAKMLKCVHPTNNLLYMNQSEILHIIRIINLRKLSYEY